MPKYTVQQLGKIIDKSPQWINEYVKRNQLVMVDRRVDTENKINKTFVAKWLRVKATNAKIKSDNKKPVKIDLGGFEIELPAAEITTTKINESIGVSNLEEVDLDREKKVAEIEFKKAQTEQTALKNAKMRGEMLPTDLVLQIITTLARSTQMAYRSAGEGLLTEIAHRHKMSAKYLADYKSELIESINQAHESGVEAAEREIHNLVIQLADWGKEDENENERPTFEI
jgi:phage terminase Nu1 subunit (DNA packaging protein)